MEGIQHIFIIGAKGFGNYGGYETFVNKLTEMHQKNKSLKYHVACKDNGQGAMNESTLQGVEIADSTHFIYHNADCFKIRVPERFGSGQAIYYDVIALKQSIEFAKKKNIQHPIFYILACRIGPFIKQYAKAIHRMGGKLFVNPDGHEWMRAKWSKPIRWYWKKSERLMVKYSDLLVCDSINIEEYIKNEYKLYDPQTAFIAYGADLKSSTMADDEPRYLAWLSDNRLETNKYYLVVGRLVPENNFETILREYMNSSTSKCLVLITTYDSTFLTLLDEKLHFSLDRRIRFVGSVYDVELLKKIRENAYAYLHGHSVGGTNPSLLEALGSTKINLLYDVGFNREVAEESALYWTLNNGDLTALINRVEGLKMNEVERYGEKAKQRVRNFYSWQQIADKYLSIFGVSDADSIS